MKRPIGLACIAALCMVLATTVGAVTVRITPDGSGDFPDIQTALNTCVTGDTIMVAPGIFQERIVWPATEGLVLIGETTAEECILDGEDSYRIITMFNPMDDTTVIKGLTLQNGNAGGVSGGGIWCNAGASPTIEGNVIRHCSGLGGSGIGCFNGSAPRIIGNTLHDNTGGNGGGIGVRNASPTISANWIHHNVGPWGAGIVVWDASNPTITENLIEDNYATAGGGGIAFYANDGTCAGLCARNEIRSNSATQTGGIVLAEGSDDVEVRDNLIVGNTSGFSCGGITVTGESNTPTISGNLILENSGPVSGGVYVYGGSTPTITVNLIRANLGHGVYCEDGANPFIEHNDFLGHAGFYGVLNADAAVVVMAENNWWGSNTGPYHPTGNPGGTGDEVSDHVDYDPWSVVTGGETPDAIASPVLHQNHPNPFNPATTIAFTLPSAQRVRLTVHAVDGRLLATLLDAQAAAGRRELTWLGQVDDGRLLPSGVYFYRLAGDGWSRTERMVLVR